MYKTHKGKNIFQSIEIYIKDYKKEFQLLCDEVDINEFSDNSDNVLFQIDMEQIIDNLNNRSYIEFEVVYDMLEDCIEDFKVLVDEDDTVEIEYKGNIDTIYFYN